MTVTIKDIAKVANVSHTTVSRALRNSPAISPNTVAKIKQIAHDLGYVPNTIARGLKMKRSGIFGVIVCRVGDPQFADVLMGIEDVVHQDGYSLFFASSSPQDNRKGEIITSMQEHRVDGIIICSSEMNQAQQKSLHSFGVPILLINAPQTLAKTLAVQHDDAYGGEQLCKHLIELGHRRIGYIGCSKLVYSNACRLNGYKAGLASANLPVEQTYIYDYEMGSQKEAKALARQIVGQGEPPSALICYEDGFAIRMIRALNQLGLEVPHHFSVVGFENNKLSSLIEPPLTTFALPKYEMGCEAARMMLHFVSSEGETAVYPQPKLLRGRLIVRNSTQTV